MENNQDAHGAYYNQYQVQAPSRKGHNHEFQSISDYEKNDEGMEHTHRIVGVTGPAIPYGKSHAHRIRVFADTSGEHYHEISDTTGPALYLNDRKHVHLLQGRTTYDDGHKHDYYFITIIEDPAHLSEQNKYYSKEI